MKYLRDPYRLPKLTSGKYRFDIVMANELPYSRQLQVAYRLGKEDDSTFRAYHIETYLIDLNEGSDFKTLMNSVFHSIYPDFVIEVNTDEMIDAGGICNIILDDNGKTKIDIKSMDFDATMCGEVDLRDEDRDVYCY